MEEEIILKKKGVSLVKKRLKELLKPLGFQAYPRSTTRLVRVRDLFIDEIRLDTAGYHLDINYCIYCRYAPFAGLKCDAGRLWRTTQAHIKTHLFWACEIPSSGGPYYYKPKYFEAVWQDVVLVLKQYILPQMEAMTEKQFHSRMLKDGPNDNDFFRAYRTVYFSDPYFSCNDEAAVYGVGQWRLGNYEEGLPYLEFARKKHRTWLTGHEQDTKHSYLCRAMALALMDKLIVLWENKGEGWEVAIQEQIGQISENWFDYMR